MVGHDDHALRNFDCFSSKLIAFVSIYAFSFGNFTDIPLSIGSGDAVEGIKFAQIAQENN